jgi:hypothetical protein
VGLFGNPAGAGTYFVIALAAGMLLLRQEYSRSGRLHWMLLFGLVMSIVGGIASQSGTFVAGTSMTMGFLLIRFRRGHAKRFRDILLWTSCAVAALVFTLNKYENVAANLRYQIGGFVNGTRLDTRYQSRESGIPQAWQDILDHPVVGLGMVRTNYFLGDSLYICLLTIGGFAGTLLFLFPIGVVFKAAWRRRGPGEFVVLWTMTMFLTGVGTNAMLNPRLGDWWWAVQGIFLSASVGARRRSLAILRQRLQSRPRATAALKPIGVFDESNASAVVQSHAIPTPSHYGRSRSN